METVAVLGALAVAYWLYNQSKAPAAAVAPPMAPNASAAQSLAAFPGTRIMSAGGNVSGGYQITPSFTPLARAGAAVAASQVQLPSVQNYVLPPVPPPIIRGGLSGPGTGGNPLGGGLARTGISAGTGTTSVGTSAFQLLPRTGILG